MSFSIFDDVNDIEHESGWIRNDSVNGIFIEVKIQKRLKDEVEVRLPNQKIVVLPSSQVLPANAKRFDGCEDVSHMTVLNEAAVLHNLKLRYDQDQIYTYSGLFLVAINPYKSLPIYEFDVLRSYKECGANSSIKQSPHIFAVADRALKAMIKGEKNQSILVTGESGAGKTENTKKVIQYLTTSSTQTSIGARGSNERSIEKEILSSTPILESFGNAQTVRNNNSSRFGKFVRIEFSTTNQISGANVVKYLLEKGRVTHRSAGERNFHVFYQLIKGCSEEEREMLGIKGMDCSNFSYLQGFSDVDGIDDAKDFHLLRQAFGELGFSNEDQMFYFKILAAILFLGNLEFENDSSDQAVLKGCANGTVDKICSLLNLSHEDFLTSLLNPTFIAGRDDVVHQRKTKNDVKYSIEALSRSLYDGLFDDIVKRINQRTTTTATLSENQKFIGVLDIAGFEIFENNSFEQLLINHTNERLQQFFNHHMFIKEQEEYAREMLQWNMIDFGLDLQPTIDCLESKGSNSGGKIGLLALLDEECLMPQATDATLAQKIGDEWMETSAIYTKDKFSPTTFTLKHYAGSVEYMIRDWITKNKDPQNTSLQRLLSKSLPGLVEEPQEDKRPTNNQTLSLKHREGLSQLLKTLSLTDPHFVRCIVPNHQKIPSKIEPLLVLEQLKCNGVLEGIRIAKEGYPNRFYFSEFKRLYQVLYTRNDILDSRLATEEILKGQNFKKGEHYLVGQTKVFLRGQQIALLEERRNAKLNERLKVFQLYLRSFIRSSRRRKLLLQEESLQKLKEHIISVLKVERWAWNVLFERTKPLFKLKKVEDEKEIMNTTIKSYEVTIKKLEEEAMTLKEENQYHIQRCIGENLLKEAALCNEISSLNEKILSLKITEKHLIEEHSNELKEKQELIQKGKEEFDGLLAVKAELEISLSERDSLIKGREENIRSLIDELKTEKENSSLLSKELLENEKASSLKLEAITKESTQMQSKLREEITEIFKKKNEEIDGLKQEIESKSEREDNLLKVSLQLKEDLASKLRAEEEMKRKIVEVEESNVNITTDLSCLKDELSSLKVMFETINKDLTVKNQKIQIERLKVDTISIELESERKEIADLLGKIEKLEQDGQLLKDQIYKMDQERTEFQCKERKQMREEKIERFESILNQIQPC